MTKDKDMEVEKIDVDMSIVNGFNPNTKEECTAYFKTGEMMSANGLLIMGKMALYYKENFTRNTEEFNQWCEKTIQYNRKTAERLIRIYEVSKQSNLGGPFGGDRFNIKKMDAVLRLLVPIKEEVVSDNYRKKDIVVKDDEGVRQYDLKLVEKFMLEHPMFEKMKLKDVESAIKEFRDANGLIKNATKKAKEIEAQAEKDAQYKREEGYKSYNERLVQMNKKEQELEKKLKEAEEFTKMKMRELESALEEREEEIRKKEEQLDIKETRQLTYIQELEKQAKELESTRDSLDIDILTNKRMLNKLSSEQEKISFIDDTLNAQQMVKQNLQILLKDDMVEYLQTDLINPKVVSGLTEVIMLCDKLIKKASKNKDVVVVDAEVRDLIIQ